jgi:hypothetical protein
MFKLVVVQLLRNQQGIPYREHVLHVFEAATTSTRGEGAIIATALTAVMTVMFMAH